MELDIVIPQFEICFEFQDPHHFATSFYYHSGQNRIRQKDNIKNETVHRNNMNLVTIPCWWDGSLERLGGSIHFHRPDLFCELEDTQIPLNPPFGYFQSGEIPGVGELMVASFPEDEIFNKALVSNTWWIGEKYDGVRFCWNPNLRTVYARSGKVLPLISPLMRKLFPIYVEGELWFGRGQFSATYMLVNGSPELVLWHMLRMILFDVPSYDYQNKPFEKRYARLLSRTTAQHPFSIIATRVLCKSIKHLRHIVDEIIDDEGEGVILRHIKSVYSPGRSPYLVKLKTTLVDAEAIVVKVNLDKSIVLGLPNGKTFTVPSSDVLISTPQIGEIVSFSYERHTREEDTPAEPKVFRVRTDVSWREVVTNASKEKQYLNDCSRSATFNVHPIAFWTAKRMQVYMENFAKEKGMDPLLPATWYKLAYEAIHQFQSGRSVLQKFNGSYFKTMQYLFPNVKFDKHSFPDTIQMRRFFEKYAEQNRFDPLKPENWYLHAKKKLLSAEGTSRLRFRYNNSVPRALLDLFPDIGLVKAKFQTLSLWSKVRNRRKFFEDYAKDHGFDPLIPENWYKQSSKKIKAAKGANRVMHYHKNSSIKALIDLFPNIGLDEAKFPRKTLWFSEESTRKFLENYARENQFDPLVPENWYYRARDIRLARKEAGVRFFNNQSVAQTLITLFPSIGLERAKFPRPTIWDVRHRRAFFEQYAKDTGTDPLVPENWYSQTRKQIESRKGAKRILFYYTGLSDALMDIFPEIGLEPSHFPTPDMWYDDLKNRRKFFEEYAKGNQFDPLDPMNWYSQSRKNILAKKDGSRVLAYHDHSVPKALVSAFPDIGLIRSKFVHT
eukprot:Phypoly_transcript_02743.p1 GENE.Phypoly_transcript_02743~~Phypoly_transcript_02743.p1  ORF type:complete len:836 (+),score=105.65 Phypoly_transcript_02743:77-2584(+)